MIYIYLFIYSVRSGLDWTVRPDGIQSGLKYGPQKKSKRSGPKTVRSRIYSLRTGPFGTGPFETRLRNCPEKNLRSGPDRTDGISTKEKGNNKENKTENDNNKSTKDNIKN